MKKSVRTIEVVWEKRVVINRRTRSEREGGVTPHPDPRDADTTGGQTTRISGTFGELKGKGNEK